MPRLRQAVAQKVADRLFAVESAIDLALTRAAELNAAMPQARSEARLPAMIGQTAFDRAAEAFSALVEARLQIGLSEVDSGDLIPKPAPTGLPEAAATAPPVAQLRAVA